MRRHTSHGRGRTHRHTSREERLADLLGRVLREMYHVTGETYEHPCSSCATDAAIFTDKARKLGVKL